MSKNFNGLIVVQGLFIWYVKGKISLAKCGLTGRFVSRANAQLAINTTLTQGV